MNIGKMVSEKLIYEGKSQSWLADKLNIAKSTLGCKLKSDTFSAIELIKIEILLNLGLEKIRKEVEEEMDEQKKEENLEVISGWINQGMISGYYPSWELTLNKDFRELEDDAFEHISEKVKEGFISGEYKDITWSIKIE